MWKVDSKHVDGHPTGRRFPSEFRSSPLEVFVPRILAGMKQPHDVVGRAFGVDASDVRLFMIVAPVATPSQILKDGPSTMLLCDDVIPVKREGVEFLAQLAVFAASLGSLPDLLSK